MAVVCSDGGGGGGGVYVCVCVCLCVCVSVCCEGGSMVGKAMV